MGKLDIQIHEVNDGYWLAEGNYFVSGGQAYASEKWVARTAKELGELVERLATEAIDSRKLLGEKGPSDG